MDEQTQQLADELDKLIERFRQEYDISYATGKATLLTLEAAERKDEV